MITTLFMLAEASQKNIPKAIYLIVVFILVGITFVGIGLSRRRKEKRAAIPFDPQNTVPTDPIGISYQPEPDIHLAGNERLRENGIHSIFDI